MFRNTFTALLVLVLLAGLTPAPADVGASAFQGELKRTKTPRERLAERSFPNVTLTTHEGRKVKFYDDLMKDKIVHHQFHVCEVRRVRVRARRRTS